MSVKAPAAPALAPELERLLRRLRLPYVREAAPEVLATATSQRWEPAEVLRVLLEGEATGRDRATIATRRRASGLPAGKTLEAWDAGAASIPAQTQRALGTLEWVERGENLCVCGPSGTGKSHFVEALGHMAIDRGKTVAWHTLESLEGLVRRHLWRQRLPARAANELGARAGVRRVDPDRALAPQRDRRPAPITAFTTSVAGQQANAGGPSPNW